MKLILFSVAIQLTFSIALRAQNFGGPNDRGMFLGERPMPNAPLTHTRPPFLKSEETLAQTWDATIAGYGNNPDGMTVNCFAEDSDNLYVGGDFLFFDTSETQFIAHYNRKTGIWDGLDGGFDNNLYALALHNGKLYAAGAFNYAGSNNTAVNHVAMWDGTSWHDLGGGMNASVYTLAFVGDTLYAGGAFTEAGGITADFLAYWDGANWWEAALGTSYPVSSLYATHDSLFVGGDFNYVGSELQNTGILARGTAMLRNGSWSSLGSGYYCSCIAFFKNKLWAAGGYYLNDGTFAGQLAAFDGAVWSTFSSDTLVGTNSTGDINALVPMGDTLVALGNFSSIAGLTSNGIAMFSNGSWSSPGNLYGEGFSAIRFDNKLYVGGRFTKAGSTNVESFATYSNGAWGTLPSPESSNVGWQSDEVVAIATTSRYVIIGGNFETIAGIPCNHVAAFDKKIGAWITLGPGVDGDVRSLAIKGDTLVVGGSFNHAGSIVCQHLAMCNLITKQWYPMGSGAHRYVGAIAVHADTIFAPVFYTYDGTYAYDYIGQWDGSNWNMFGNGLRVGYINALAWQGSTLFAGGTFARSDEQTVLNGVAQIQEGNSWGSLNSGVNSYVYALAVSGDSLFVGGGFTLADGQVDSALAVWNGSSWNPIGAAGFDGPVYALAGDGKGGVYAGGNFSEVAQVGRGRLVHWNGKTYGTVAAGVDNTVSSLATDSVALYVGGWLTTAGSNQTESLHFAALDGAGVDAVNAPAPIPASLAIYPNPAVNISAVSFTLPKASQVRLELFNAIGTKISTLADVYFSSGDHEFSIGAKGLTPGIYFLRLTENGRSEMQNFVVE